MPLLRGDSPWRRVVRTPVGACAAVLLAGLLLLAVIAPPLWSAQAEAVDADRLQAGMSAEHWLGTDSLGRDILLRVLVATRLSILLTLLATAIGVVTGILLGAVPAVLGRRVERLAAAIVNTAVAFPALLLALFLAVIFGVGVTGAVAAIGLAIAPSFARLTQTLIASVAGRDFVSAARIAGVGKLRLLTRHILPNIGEPLVVNATIGAGNALIAFAGLSFLGLGVQAPDYDWGRLLGDGLQGIYVHPAAALAPGVAVVVAGLAFNLFGESAAKAIGPPPPARPRTAPPSPHPGPRALSEPVTSPAPASSADQLARTPLSSASTGMSTAAVAGTPDPADAAGRTSEPVVLAVENLHVSFPAGQGWVTPVRGVSFQVRRGETVGVVGESGSGKSLTALAVARLLEDPAVVTADRLEFQGGSLLGTGGNRLRQQMGTSFAMIFQNPMNAFNPVLRVGRQLAEVVEQHQGASRRKGLTRAVDRLRAVRVPAAHRRAHQYPHEFSGGMLQRAMIAMGIMGTPALIVADEPTTALDVTVQRRILELLARISADDAVAIVLISHDISVVSQLCRRVLVMYAGRVVEDLPVGQEARHPYTRALLSAVPDMETDRDQPLATIPGRPPDAAEQPTGCAFATRCPLAGERCTAEDPPLTLLAPGHKVACWHPGGATAGAPSTAGAEQTASPVAGCAAGSTAHTTAGAVAHAEGGSPAGDQHLLRKQDTHGLQGPMEGGAT